MQNFKVKKILKSYLLFKMKVPMSATLNPSNNNNFVIFEPILIKLLKLFINFYSY